MSENLLDLLGILDDGDNYHKRWSRTERGVKYYHVQASMKAKKAIRANIKAYLKSNLHQGKHLIIRNLNWKVRGWLQYFTMPGTTHAWRAAFQLQGYLRWSLCRHHRRKSQRYNAAYCQNAYYVWVTKHGLIDPMEF